MFHETLGKLNTTTSPNQKEKVEGDLKKEIKKLQRLRDQIKGWQTLSEIKDKAPINEARKAIETEMERFKVLEKEMKIKAFSKEGLNQATKIDPKEKERLELTNWINDIVDKLNTGTDAFEAECESIRLSAKKNKKLDSSKQERVNELGKSIERHKYHIKKLELIRRLLENEKLEVDDVDVIKEDIEYYVESHEDPDFVENDQLYDDLDLANSESSDPEEDSEEDENEILTPVPKSQTSPPPPTIPQVTIVKKPVLPPKPTTVPSVPVVSPPAAPAVISPKVGGPSFASAASVLPAQSASTPSTSFQPSSISFAAAAKPVHEQFSAQRTSSAGYEDLLMTLSNQGRIKPDLISILNNSYQNCPDGFEMENSRSFVPKQPVTLPEYYPSTPPAILENPAIFERLDLDTLFFIFYYQQKTYPQYPFTLLN